MQNYIGSDITSMVTLPVMIFEPMTMIQKMAEVCNNFSVHHFFVDCSRFVTLAISRIFGTANGILSSTRPSR